MLLTKSFKYVDDLSLGEVRPAKQVSQIGSVDQDFDAWAKANHLKLNQIWRPQLLKMAAPINQIKQSDLKFVKQIGEGGFSSVYQMTWIHPSLGPIQIAAKKLIKRDVKELDIMSGLDHPNIVKLIGVVDEQMEFMLILELCDRGSLRSYLKELNGGRLPDKQFYDWAEQAARPLEYLRQIHLVHKDVKSPNYMITAENNLKLGDFGISKNLEHTISHATDSASWRWMAPELAEGILSPKYDIFGYGMVLWEMRTGMLPFQGLESQVVVMRVCYENERLPIPEHCPPTIKELMKQCWEANWRMRPNIKEVISVITATAASQEAPPTAPVGQWDDLTAPPIPPKATTAPVGQLDDLIAPPIPPKLPKLPKPPKPPGRQWNDSDDVYEFYPDHLKLQLPTPPPWFFHKISRGHAEQILPTELRPG
ncbi:mitogen-activated protein kinase kinase kinase 20-like [Amphiura filiformis]|uniref:mitogen-activated protein kinase kinase kinase 20-like n=1 Tax=Amphiura filiformis TaxID=82378 RepID=UPI003B2220C7